MGLSIVLALLPRSDDLVAWHGYLHSDRTAIQAVATLLAVSALLARARPDWAGAVGGILGRRSSPWIATTLAVLLAWAGARLVFFGVLVTCDEVMAEFDAAVLASGHLAAPIPEPFRALRPALQPKFALPIAGDHAWISAYWPGNAALRALAARTIGAGWASPLLLGLGLAATWGCARTLWPERRDVAALAVILLASSAQSLVMAMTPWAMTAHFALNMVWLWLFLRDRPLAHAGALVVGALAIGLHQIVFHPLFVAPFLVLMVTRRRFALAAVYAGAYALFGLAWLAYPVLLAWAVSPEASLVNPVTAFLDRLATPMASGITGHNSAATLMTLNLTRLVAWLNPAILLFAALGLPFALRSSPIARSLAAGIVLTTVAMGIVLPYQGHGWGYRYLHGLLGPLALLAAFGFGDRTRDSRTQFWPTVAAVLTAGSLMLLVPLQAWTASRHAAPVAAATQTIREAPADVVVVDDEGVGFGVDLVQNAPDLSNRPLVVYLPALSDALIGRVCALGRVAVFDFEAARRADYVFLDPAGPAPKTALRKALEARCPVKVL
jgi:hypothetical protein